MVSWPSASVTTATPWLASMAGLVWRPWIDEGTSPIVLPRPSLAPLSAPCAS